MAKWMRRQRRQEEPVADLSGAEAESVYAAATEWPRVGDGKEVDAEEVLAVAVTAVLLENQHDLSRIFDALWEATANRRSTSLRIEGETWWVKLPPGSWVILVQYIDHGVTMEVENNGVHCEWVGLPGDQRVLAVTNSDENVEATVPEIVHWLLEEWECVDTSAVLRWILLIPPPQPEVVRLARKRKGNRRPM